MCGKEWVEGYGRYNLVFWFDVEGWNTPFGCHASCAMYPTTLPDEVGALSIHCTMCIRACFTALCARCLSVEHCALPLLCRWIYLVQLTAHLTSFAGLGNSIGLGGGPSSDYVSVSEEEVSRYVLFDIEDDTLLSFGRLILRQGGKGVLVGPIGVNLVFMEGGHLGFRGGQGGGGVQAK